MTTTSVHGYKVFKTIPEFQKAYHALILNEIEPLKEQGLCGTVYTQVSDIEDEINGILTYDRKICKL